MYVKLFGGPYDGRMENVVDGANSLRLNAPIEPFGITPEPPAGEPCPMPTRTYAVYRRSEADPARFVYEGPDE